MIRKTPLALVVASTLVFAALSTFSFGAEKAEIKCDWPEGSYSIRQEMFVSSIKTINKEVAARQQTKAQFVWNVDAAAVQNGEQRLTLTASRVLLRFEGDGRELFYSDSENTLNGKEYELKVYHRFFNVPIFVVLKDGKVDRVDGCDALWENLDAPSSDEETFFLETLKTVATPASFGDVFNQLGYPLPEAPAAIGDVWQTAVEYELPAFGMQNVVWDCRFDAITSDGRDKLANVKATSTLELGANADARVKMEIEAKYNLNDKNIVEFVSRATVVATAVGAAKIEGSDEKQKVEVKTTGQVRNKLTVVKR